VEYRFESRSQLRTIFSSANWKLLSPALCNFIALTGTATSLRAQVILILTVVRALSFLLVKLNQPSVVGEILAGILLGPSFLGYIPGFTNYVFPESSLGYLNVIAQVGLIFFMFFLGLEVDPGLLFNNWRVSLPVAGMKMIYASISYSFPNYGAITHSLPTSYRTRARLSSHSLVDCGAVRNRPWRGELAVGDGPVAQHHPYQGTLSWSSEAIL
jgi:hypothetical protein